MARGAGGEDDAAGPPAAVASPGTSATAGDADPAEPYEVVNISDAGAIKRVLDDTATQVVLDAGYPEAHTVNNTKIVLGLTAIACAAAAQLYPVKVPDSFHVRAPGLFA